MRARAVVACVDSDAENIFITLTARELRPDIAIVARAAAEESEPKLRRAGASRVISPYKTSGSEMARLALQPAGVRRARRRRPSTAWRRSRSPRAARARAATIGDVRGGAIIVGVREPDGTFHPQPPAETVAQRRRRSSWRSAPSARWSASRPCSSRPRAERSGVTPVSDLRAAVQAAVAALAADGVRSAPTLERPKQADHGDYATNAALLLAPAPAGAAARRRRAARRRAARAAGRHARPRRGRRAGLPEPVPGRRLVRRRARLGARGRRALRRRRAGDAAAGATSSSSRPTRPAR